MPPAILAEIVGDYRVHLLSDFACKVTDFLAFQIPLQDIRYLDCKMVLFVVDGVGKLI